MVAPERTCGHPNCRRNGRACTLQHRSTLSISQLLAFQQLRQVKAVGQYSNYVLLRIVRLTIETNALTGTYFLINTLWTSI